MIVAQIFRMRTDFTKLAFGENGFVQTTEGGAAVPFGPVMVHNFLQDFDIADVELRPFFSVVEFPEVKFEEILHELQRIHGGPGPQFKRFDRLVLYTSMRYVIRDYCQIQQKTLRKRIDLNASLKCVSSCIVFER
jgi:hypothetical protein